MDNYAILKIYDIDNTVWSSKTTKFMKTTGSTPGSRAAFSIHRMLDLGPEYVIEDFFCESGPHIVAAFQLLKVLLKSRFLPIFLHL